MGWSKMLKGNYFDWILSNFHGERWPYTQVVIEKKREPPAIVKQNPHCWTKGKKRTCYCKLICWLNPNQRSKEFHLRDNWTTIFSENNGEVYEIVPKSRNEKRKSTTKGSFLMGDESEREILFSQCI